MPKIQPAQIQLSYLITDGTSYIDLARDLSRVNRRMYRQGMMYAISDIQVGNNIGTKTSDITQISFSTIPNTWVVHNAWKKGFKTWQRMQNEYMDGQGSRLKGKWADFKIFADDSMQAGTVADVIAGDGAVYESGEWVYSNFVYDDAGTARTPSIHMVGTSTDDSAIGLIEAYGDARNYPGTEPTNIGGMATGFYAQFHGVGDIDDELGTDIRDDNDLPPYEQDAYPGGHSNGDALISTRYASVTATNPVSVLPGFAVPCGLLKVVLAERSLNNTMHITDESGATVDAPGPNSVYSIASAPSTSVIITLAPGGYRGVMATPMGQ